MRLPIIFLALTSMVSVARAEPRRWSPLKQLVGTWEAKTHEGAVIRSTYRLVSNESALVQSFVTPSKKETLTVFHIDGARVLATHYCAQGNQPRLALDDKLTTDRTFVFRYVDATNLATPTASHLARLELRMDAADAYTEVETYEANGKPDVTTLHFHRVP